MGYVHDTAMSQWLPPSLAHYVTGTWADAAGQVATTIVKQKAAADNTATLTIPIVIPSNSAAYKGCKVSTIDVYWEVTVAALDALSATIYLVTLPANGAAIAAPASQAFSYDTGHDTAGERLTLDQHTMTLTLTTAIWLDNDQVLQVELSVNAAAASVFDYIGTRVNYTLRV